MSSFLHSSMRTVPPVGCSGTWARLRILALASAILLSSATMAVAVPILAEVVGCTGGLLGTCTVEPIGGPVDVDPLGFTLEVTWGPDYILFTPDPGGGTQQGLMHLFFDFTGTHQGTEHLGDITFLDAGGNPILDPNVGFDDLNPAAGVVTANYEIFGSSAFIHGFSLSLSDGSGVDSMQWTSATIHPASLVQVPEPSLLWLLGAGFGLAIRRRCSRARNQFVPRA
jgi:PEP-CTERM motif-containing protein